jgi:GNAT superfamily N-acetyltransferase
LVVFELLTKDTLEFALDIVNSNPKYNRMENGRPSRISSDLTNDFLNPGTDTFLVKIENKPIGIIDFLKENPNDHAPWIGLLMIHGDYHSLGYGKMVYAHFEEELMQKGLKNVRLGVLQQNVAARHFWEAQGFKFCKESQWDGKAVHCFEKRFI